MPALFTRPAPPHAHLPGLLWLLLALPVAVVPHLWEQPLWVLAIVYGAWLWRLGIHLYWPRLPAPWVMLVLALGAAGWTLFQFHGPFGQVAGTALLLVMVSLKLLEIRSTRDIVISVFLGYFVIVTTYLFNQSFWIALYSLFSTWLMTVALIQVHAGRVIPTRTLARQAGLMLVHATPIMLILFVLFPRIPGPLWGAPVQDRSAFTGLSEQLAPGDIAELLMNEATAVRVRFDGDPPPSNQQYWRALVMTDFNGRTWRVDQDRPEIPFPGTETGTDLIHYTATLEPTGARYLPILEYPMAIATTARLRDNFQVDRDRPIDSRLTYAGAAQVLAPLAWPLSDAERRRALALPEGSAPRAHIQAGLWRQTHGQDNWAIIQAALEQFAGDPFRYTLRPPALSGDYTDSFLFTTQAGYCEHYASSFAVLMRAAGIPARVITGYQGGQWMDNGQYLRLRHADAHAWTEVWLEEQGWVRVDPTAAIAPERIEQGLMDFFADDLDAPAFIRRSGLPWTTNWRLQVSDWHDMLTFRWEHLVLAFDPERQREIFARLGLDASDWRSIIIALVGAFGLLGLVVGLIAWLQRPRQSLDPAQRLLRRLQRHLKRRGYPARTPHETVPHYAKRLGQQAPALQEPLQSFAGAYTRLRYGNPADPVAEEEQLRAAYQRVRVVQGQGQG